MSDKKSGSLLAAVIVSLGGFVFGFDASVISGVVGFITNEFNLSAWQVGMVVAAPTLGGFIASFIAGPVADQVGRKRVLIVIAALYVFSAIGSALTPNYEVLVLARFIGGLAFVSLMLAPMYIAEISRPELRGKRVAINQLNIVVGFSAAYFANYLFFQLSQEEADWIFAMSIKENTWRWMLGIELIPALVYLLLLFSIPESPRWLIIKNRVPEARVVIKKLAIADDPDLQIREVKATLNEIELSFVEHVKKLFGKRTRLILVIGVIAGVTQQITGVNAVYFYAPTIFEQSGVGTNAAFSQAIWVGVINIIFTLVAMYFIDKIGRRPLMLIGLAGVLISMSICSFGFYQSSYKLDASKLSSVSESIDHNKLVVMADKQFTNDVEFKKALKRVLGDTEYRQHESELIKLAITINSSLVLFGILGFVASFAVSLGPVMWVLLSEIFPTQIRGTAISFVAVINAAVSFCVQLLFPWELDNLGAATTFLIYGSFALIGLLLMSWLLPETKGKTLEEIERDFIATNDRKRLRSTQKVFAG